ncbi:MAG: hypothetical protein Q9216_002234 [Gyalolechia sp. 2 TL-2023]
MDAPQDEAPLRNQPSHSAPSSPSPPSDDPTLCDDRNTPDALTNHESALLDNSSILLEQEYDYQRQLISHYSTIRNHGTHHGTLPQHTENHGQPIPPSWSHIYEKSRESPFLPPGTSMDDEAAFQKGYPASYNNAYAYQYNQPRRPLLDFINNQWRSSTSSPPFPPTSAPAPSVLQIMSAPRLRRYMMAILLVILLPWASWRWYGRPRWQERQLLNDAFEGNLQTGAAWYGVNLRPMFKDMIQLRTLDSTQLPRSENKSRLIFVGGVHGCHDELQALLSKTEYDNRTDHMIFTGDLVSKGPTSSAVVDFALEQNASCVRGNHEDRILLAHRDVQIHRTFLPGPDESSDDRPPESGNAETDKLDEESFSHGDYVDRQFAKSLTTEQASYLASCPLILDISNVPSLSHLVVAHAGLVPGVELENQDPMGVMNMRTVDLKTHVPSRSHIGTPWYKLWNKHQSVLPASDRSTVIYAHDSKSGLQMHGYSKGIDSGCAGGGKLTALVMTIESQEKVEEEVVSVQCKDYSKQKGKWRGWGDLPFMEIKDDTHGGTGSGHF